MIKNKVLRRVRWKERVCMVAFGVVAIGSNVVGADDSALLDALVKKGVLSQKEADTIQSSVKDQALQSSNSYQGLVNKIQVGSWIKELNLSGDLRIRNYYTSQQQQLPAPRNVHNYDANIQRDRWRFRLRLNADFLLEDGWFGGVQLSTSDNRDSATQNATFTGGYDNYNIYISRAFLGWQANPGMTFIAGRQDNPFYATEMFWGLDYGVNGLVERIDFHKLFNMSFGEQTVETGKDYKEVISNAKPSGKNGFELSLIAGQFIFFSNNQDLSFGQGQTDAYQFETQLVGKLNLMDGKLTITEAPGIFIANDATLGATRLLKNGQPDPASIPASGTGNLGSLNNLNPFPVSQKDELMILAPGDITYELGNIPITLYWDFAYNLQGNDRFNTVLGPLFSNVSFNSKGSPVFSNRAKPSLSDNLAWLIGLRVGQNKKAGDLSLAADFRQIGIASEDPNINTDDFAESNLNSQGFKIAAAYNINDFVVISVNAWLSWNLTGNLYGGFATSPAPFSIANGNSDTVLAVDFMMKF